MNKAHANINWKNFPSTDSPLNDVNLNKMDTSIDEIDNRVITLDTTKATKTEVATIIADVSFNETTGIFTFTRKNGATFTLDTKLEKIAVNFKYDYNNQKLILTLIDGTKQEVDLSALITQYEFTDSGTIHFSINSEGKVTAIVKEGSIEEKHLQPNYLADVKVEVAKAESASSSANIYAGNAQGYASEAFESSKNAKTSESAALNYSSQASAYNDSASDFSSQASAYAEDAFSAATAAHESEENAKKWENQAESIAEGLKGGIIPMGTITFSNLPNTSTAGYMYNISDGFTTTSRFKEGAGHEEPPGSNVYYTADGYWDVMAGAPVSGVKGALENTYRRGYVNITTEDIGAVYMRNTSGRVDYAYISNIYDSGDGYMLDGKTYSMIASQYALFSAYNKLKKEVSTSSSGLCPKLSGNKNHFLRGDGTFSSVERLDYLGETYGGAVIFDEIDVDGCATIMVGLKDGTDNSIDIYPDKTSFSQPIETVGGKINAESGWTGKINGYTIGANVPSNAVFTDTTYSLVGTNGTTGLIKNGSAVTSSSGYIPCPIINGIPYYKNDGGGAVIDTDTWIHVSTTEDGYIDKLPGSYDKYYHGDGTWDYMTKMYRKASENSSFEGAVAFLDMTWIEDDGQTKWQFKYGDFLSDISLVHNHIEMRSIDKDNINYFYIWPDKIQSKWGNITSDGWTGKVNGHTINEDVPSGAKFTDTNTWNKVTTSQDGYITKLPGNTTNFLRGDGTWAVPPNTWNKVSTTQDGYVTKLPGNTTTFLRGDGTWAVPPGSSSSGATYEIVSTTAPGLCPKLTGDKRQFLRGDGSFAKVDGIEYSDDDGYSGYVLFDFLGVDGYGTISVSSSDDTNYIDMHLDKTVFGRPAEFPGGKTDSVKGWVGKVNGYTIGTNVPSNAVFTDTHNTAFLYVGKSTGTANASTTNGNTYLILSDGGTVQSRRKISGSGSVTVTSDLSGNITIHGAAADLSGIGYDLDVSCTMPEGSTVPADRYTFLSSNDMLVIGNKDSGSRILMLKGYSSDVYVEGLEVFLNSNNNDATDSVYFDGGGFAPYSYHSGDGDGQIDLGFGAARWKNIYATTGTIQTSDRNQKTDFEILDTKKSIDLINGLVPYSYKMKDGTSDRRHHGIVAQDLEILLGDLGIDTQDFAGFIKSPKTEMVKDENGKTMRKTIDGEYDYGLRYQEFFADEVVMLQYLYRAVCKMYDNLGLSMPEF